MLINLIYKIYFKMTFYFDCFFFFTIESSIFAHIFCCVNYKTPLVEYTPLTGYTSSC